MRRLMLSLVWGATAAGSRGYHGGRRDGFAEPTQVKLQETALPVAEALRYRFPAHSVTMLVFTAG